MALGNFQRIVLLLSFILLLIILLFIGYALYKSKNSQSWPPEIQNCPDYWIDISGNGASCVNVKNLGTCGQKKMNFNVSPYTGSSGNCSKYNWATRCNISWDGVTYGVPNPCNT